MKQLKPWLIRSARACFFVAALLAAAAVSAQNFTQIVAFGDSWTDPDSGDPDGPSHAYVLASLLNRPIMNDAVGGATSEDAIGQVNNYLAGGVDPDAIHLYWIAGNDFNLPGGLDDPSATVVLMMDNMTTALSLLQQSGAQHFLVFNSIDNALRPRVIISGTEAMATSISLEWNDAINVVLAERGLQGPLFNTYILFNEIVLDPRFTNVTQSCAANNCTNRDEYMWWDDDHPSSETHRMIADAVFAQLTAAPGMGPTIVSGARTSATVGVRYVYDVDATDPDAGDTLMFGLTVAPTGMTIDRASGLIEWTPAASDTGNHNVEVTVTDNIGLMDSQAFSISVVQQPPPGGGTTSSGGGSTGWLTLALIAWLLLRQRTVLAVTNWARR